jgi:hypothetical protein
VFVDLRKRMIWVGGLTLATAIIQLTSVRRASEHREATDRPSQYLKQPSTQTAPPAAPVDHIASAHAERVLARAKRDALRDQIVDAQRSAPAQPLPTEESARPGDLKKTIRGHDELVAHLNKDFMPLAQACVEQAQQRSPSLRGMLTLEVETLADEQLGALIERAEVPAESAVQDRELAECIRENALTLTFPPPLRSGPDKFQLTLLTEPAK